MSNALLLPPRSDVGSALFRHQPHAEGRLPRFGHPRFSEEATWWNSDGTRGAQRGCGTHLFAFPYFSIFIYSISTQRRRIGLARGFRPGGSERAGKGSVCSLNKPCFSRRALQQGYVRLTTLRQRYSPLGEVVAQQENFDFFSSSSTSSF